MMLRPMKSGTLATELEPEKSGRFWTPWSRPEDSRSPRHSLRAFGGRGYGDRTPGELVGVAPSSQGQTYVLLGNRADASITLLSERLTDQTRAVLIFGDPVAAEAFRVVENLGSEWRVVADRPGEMVELLEAAAMSGARYVALDPPTARSLAAM
jgi:hypothetical protein